MTVDDLENALEDYFILCCILISDHYKMEELQRQSYAFLNDDKKMAEHFRLNIPMVQGFEARKIFKQVHEYVKKNELKHRDALKAIKRMKIILNKREVNK